MPKNHLRYSFEMIVIEIKKIAKSRGFATAYQFQKITGFAPAMASRIFKGKWTRINVSTIDTICSALNCTPNDILKFIPDKREE